MITAGEGKYKVFLEKKDLNGDLIYILGGGEKPHIGGIVICEPGKKTRMIRLGTHHDHEVLTPIAEKACEKFNKTVVAVGGIHIDNAKKGEINTIIENCRQLLKQL